MNVTAALINLAICFMGIVLSVRAIRTKSFSFLPIYILLFIITNSLGISLVFHTEFSQAIWPVMYDKLVGTRDYIALCICTWMFIGMALFLMKRIPAQSNSKAKFWLEIPSDVALGLAVALLGLGHLLYLKFMFFGPGLASALATNFFQYDFSSAYEHRRELEGMVEQGQGLLMATVASFVIMPLSAFFSIVSKKGRGTVLVICALNFIFSFLFCVALRQKAPVLLTLLLYCFLYLHFVRRAVLTSLVARFTDAKAVVVGSVLFLAGLSLFYQITEGEEFRESVAHSIFRILIIPVVSNQAWIVAFPDILPFRGFIGIFDTIFWGAGGIPVSAHDISEVLTGYRFSLNASMVPVAWSAAGFQGAFAISAIFCLIAFVIDRLLRRLNPELFFPMIVLSLPSLLALTSTSFFDFVAKGGFLVQFAIIGAHILFGKVRSTAPLAGAKQCGSQIAIGVSTVETSLRGRPFKTDNV